MQPTATERAYAYAKDRILDGRFAGGELISEGEVAAGVKLSRTPVREAFLRLETEGLLRLFPKRGALVVAVSPGEVEAVMETRELVERFALAKVIESGVDLREVLEETIQIQEALAAKGHPGKFVEADRELHRTIVEAAGNPILLDLYDSLRDRQHRMNLYALARDADRLVAIGQEHRALVAAVVDRDLTKALETISRHLQGTFALLRTGPVGGRDGAKSRRGTGR